MQLFSVANEDVRPTQRRVTIYSSPICSLTIRWHLAQDTLCYLCVSFCTLKAKSCSSASPGAAVGLHLATFPSPLIGSNDPHYCSSNHFIIHKPPSLTHYCSSKCFIIHQTHIPQPTTCLYIADLIHKLRLHFRDLQSYTRQISSLSLLSSISLCLHFQLNLN